MTLEEKYDWLTSIADQAKCLSATPEDMLMVAGAILTAGISKLPKCERPRALLEWVDHASRAIQAHAAFADALGSPNVRRH
jgi:hypothetical protein